MYGRRMQPSNVGELIMFGKAQSHDPRNCRLNRLRASKSLADHPKMENFLLVTVFLE